VAKINSMILGRSSLSFVDAVPFAHSESAYETVSDSLSERLSCQRAQGAVDRFTVVTVGDATLGGGGA
jgi:hypothetical protein